MRKPTVVDVTDNFICIAVVLPCTGIFGYHTLCKSLVRSLLSLRS